MKTLSGLFQSYCNYTHKLIKLNKTVFSIVFIPLFILIILIIAGSCSKKNTGIYSVTPEKLCKDLSTGVKVHGMAVVSPYTEYLGLSYSTYQRWEINLVLADSTPYELSLAKDLFLVESNPEASIFDGIAYCRGQQRKDYDIDNMSSQGSDSILLSNPLNNYEIHYTDDGYFKRQGNRITYTTNDQNSRHKHKKSAIASDFGKMFPGGKTTIELTLDEGIWLKNEILASVRIILPEIDVMTKNGKERFRLTVFFSKANIDSAKWHITRQELTPLKFDELAKTFETTETNTITRIFAANWMTEIDKVKSAPIIISICQTLKQGMILATGLDLLTELKSPKLADHAMKLFSDKDSPDGIRSRAGLYLGIIQYLPALPSILSAMNDKEDLISNNAIKSAGYFRDRKAFDALSNLLMKKKDSEKATEIAEALLNTKDTSAVSVLEQLADKKNEACLNALINSKLPECFTYFQHLLHDGKHKEWRENLIRGMKICGGTKSLPELVDLLQTEKQLVESYFYPSALVKDIITLNPELYKQKLTDLAHKGNLCAIQVFAGWDNIYAHTMLLEIAGNGNGPGQRIALDGISENWPNESRDLLHAMLKNKNPVLVCSAIQGLKNTGDSTEIESIVPFLENNNLSISQAAASAIGELGPGKQAQTILKTLLKTDDYSIAINLSNALTEHNWKDKNAIKPLANRLKTLKGEICFPIIQLLRHLSGNALGPDGYGQWYNKQDEWKTKWCEWAAKH